MHHNGGTYNNSGNTTTVTRHLLIRGHVQGVGYRWSLVQAALQRGVQGWVRNRRDGSVEALATGPADAVQSLIDWARHGPPQARVDAVDVGTVAEPAEPVAGFVQRETV
ncbi:MULTISPECIES: acylphosphatase [unclassified Acidovorax]|uniref:acylphosphatase n=1 Tax=unclassified Acidovorax TaxID=2684926 RepID=UPI001C4889B4|nr:MULTISPECIES: acylphosphatase [unclassified Acidovorax]MBV7429834.1 acylphosphatase [Acidovorax sp. sif0732]MBV7448912.1 acylphosphatase [Acidovorax sp. sif0715]